MALKGLDSLIAELDELRALLENPEIASEQLADSMRDVVHVQSGHLKATIYHRGNIAGAAAEYAGFEEERGGDHAYGTMAIDLFDMEQYADKIWEAFE